MTTLQVILVAWLVSAIVMAALWLVQRRTRNAGTVDVAWAFGTGIAAAVFAATAPGAVERRAVVAVLGLAWGLRLGVHLLRRVRGEAEDGRYRTMREAMGARADLGFFVFFQVQAAWVVLFALPMLLAASSARPALDALDALGIAIWIAAMTGEAIADRQLARFRADPAHRGAVCDVGLWRYSRHPNYFFEWVHWWAYVPLAAGAPNAWLAWLGPVVMYVFLTRLTGIPHTERRALQTRGDAYRRYQQTTSSFIPLPRRRAGISQEQSR